MRAGRADTLLQESGPIVRGNRTQLANQVVERVSDHFRRTAFPAMKAPAEIVERTPAAALLANDGVYLQPDEVAFGVVVEPAPPVLPLRTEHPERLHGHGGVFERAPGAALTVVEHSRGHRQFFPVLLGCPQARACC